MDKRKMNSDNILECPCCEKPATLWHDIDENTYWIECTACHIRTDAHWNKSTIEYDWGVRNTFTSLNDKIQELRDIRADIYDL